LRIKSEGGTVEFGGAAASGELQKGAYFVPTMITGVNDNDTIAQFEPFGGYKQSGNAKDKFIELNKTFDLMIYPDRSHSIKEKENTKRHLYDLMTEFLREKLPPNEI
jgi:hypothetical protein